MMGLERRREGRRKIGKIENNEGKYIVGRMKEQEKKGKKEKSREGGTKKRRKGNIFGVGEVRKKEEKGVKR